MVIRTLILLALGTSGLAVAPKQRIHDVSELVDDFLAFIEPVMRARGDTEIEFGAISSSKSIHMGKKLIKHHLKKTISPKVRVLLEDPDVPIPFSFSCEKGVLGDVSTLKRIGPADETKYTVGENQDLTVVSQYTLEKMYVEYPKCKFALAHLPFNGQLKFRIPHNNFTTTLDLHSSGKDCGISDGNSILGSNPIDIKTTVNGTPYNVLFEQLIDYLINEYPDFVRIKANFKLGDALNLAAMKYKACGFLNDKIFHHVKNKHQ